FDILQLNDMLVHELKDLAEQLGLKGFKKLNKQELIYKILDQQALAKESNKKNGKNESSDSPEDKTSKSSQQSHSDKSTRNSRQKNTDTNPSSEAENTQDSPNDNTERRRPRIKITEEERSRRTIRGSNEDLFAKQQFEQNHESNIEEQPENEAAMNTSDDFTKENDETSKVPVP